MSTKFRAFRAVMLAHLLSLALWLTVTTTVFIHRPRRRGERGASGVEWLVVLGAAVGIAYFAGDSIMAFAKGLVGQLGK